MKTRKEKRKIGRDVASQSEKEKKNADSTIDLNEMIDGNDPCVCEYTINNVFCESEWIDDVINVI